MSIKHKKLGNTELEVSPLGLGTVKFGRNQGVKYPESFFIPSIQNVAAILDMAREHNINLLDTAPAYGMAEQRLGTLINKQRHDWILSSKVGEEFIDGNSSFDFSAKHTEQSIHRSLKNLQTDYLDLVLVHSNGDDLDIINNTDVFSVLEKFKQQGTIRYFGISSKTVAGGKEALNFCDVMMLTYNLSEQDQLPVLNKAIELNKGVMIKKPLMSGHLQSYSLQQCVDFIFQHKAVDSIIVGTINEQHLVANVKAVAESTSVKAASTSQ